MKSTEIIFNIENIYKKYEIPCSLQMHMLRAASVGALICDNWKGPKINIENIIATLLIHDLGNVAKIDYEHKENISILGREKSKLQSLRNAQKKFMKKYGKNADEASVRIAKELKVNKKIIYILKKASFKQLEQNVKSKNHELKIVKYSDLRVDPYGIVSLKHRLREAQKRYKIIGIDFKKTLREKALLNAAFNLETQVMKNCRIKKEEINNLSVHKYFIIFNKNNSGK